MSDAHGNYVVQHMLRKATPDQTAALSQQLVGNIAALSMQKFSSNVVEKVFELVDDKLRSQLLDELCEPSAAATLFRDPYANYVVQRCLSVVTDSQGLRMLDALRCVTQHCCRLLPPHVHQSPHTQPFPSLSRSHAATMAQTPGGRRILAVLARRFPDPNTLRFENAAELIAAAAAAEASSGTGGGAGGAGSGGAAGKRGGGRARDKKRSSRGQRR